MNVPVKFYGNTRLKSTSSTSSGSIPRGLGGFLPALKQMPTLLRSLALVMPALDADAHAGYGFAIGNVTAYDMSDPNAVVSGGVGFEHNCGVRLCEQIYGEGSRSQRKILCNSCLITFLLELVARASARQIWTIEPALALGMDTRCVKRSRMGRG